MKTLKRKENIEQIAKSIDNHFKKEQSSYLSNKAFARACCTLDATYGGVMDKVFWLVNSQNTRGMKIGRDFSGSGTVVSSGYRTTLEDDGQSVYKNTKLGEILTKAYQGTYHYTTKTELKRINNIDITIHNRSVYVPNSNRVEEIEVRIAGDSNCYRFQTLKALLNAKAADEEALRKHREELRKLKEEKAKAEKEIRERQEKEERERLEELKCRKEEEERLRAEEIKRLENSIKETNEKINSVKYFFRKNVFLRYQPMLDISQDDAKRSHIYDGVPIVISGGPGTGKTTTVIQRLKFLLDRDALNKDDDGYDSPLTHEQIDFLTDPHEYNSRWLFFSPTDLLLYYLRNNMNEEGLNATDENTRTLPKFRQIIMRDYSLFDPTKDGPFKNYKSIKGEDKLIVDPMKVISEFEKFCVDYLKRNIGQSVILQTSQYGWHHLALRIKSVCSNYNDITTIEALVRLFYSLKESERENVKLIEEELKQLLNSESIKLKQSISKDNDKLSAIHELFEKWKKENKQSVDNEDEMLDDEEEEIMETFSKQEFEAQLFSQIKQLLRGISLKKIDGKIKLSKRNNEFLACIENVISDDIKFIEIGEKAWFVKNFASLCSGIESNILRRIPAIYKQFRKNILEESEKNAVNVGSDLIYMSSPLYVDELLAKIIKKDKNKHLHTDEQNLLVGFINNLLFNINKKFRLLFNELNHRYVIAYKKHVKPVIGIDEATDYSLLDYYFMISFRYYDFSSITLSGDIMQGLSSNGIRSWKDLKDTVLPNLEIRPLNISYRQLPTLLDMARDMYKDDQGEYPAYYSDKEKSDDEPKPLLYISDDEEEKAVWISNRILDIYNAYNKELPSVAIFVGEDVNIKDFIDRIVDLDILNGIEIVDCSGNTALQNKEVVRVFRLHEVKGMEFEAVFFYNIDQAIKGHSIDLMRRYLYVGVSRATSHLAATMCSGDGEEDIIKYFDAKMESW